VRRKRDLSSTTREERDTQRKGRASEPTALRGENFPEKRKSTPPATATRMVRLKKGAVNNTRNRKKRKKKRKKKSLPPALRNHPGDVPLGKGPAKNVLSIQKNDHQQKNEQVKKPSQQTEKRNDPCQKPLKLTAQ